MKQYLTNGLIVLCVILFLLCGWFYHGKEKARGDAQTVRLEFSQYVIEQKIASLGASANVKDEMEKVSHDGEEKQKVGEQKIADLELQLGSAYADNERMREQLEAARVRLSNSTATARECKAALDAAGVYAELYGECITQYSKMAAYAQRAGSAGVTCEKSYGVIMSTLSK